MRGGAVIDSPGACNTTAVPPQCICARPFGGPTCAYRRASQRSALTLSIVLGPYGAERFYIGRTRSVGGGHEPSNGAAHRCVAGGLAAARR